MAFAHRLVFGQSANQVKEGRISLTIQQMSIADVGTSRQTTSGVSVPSHATSPAVAFGPIHAIYKQVHSCRGLPLERVL